MTKKHDELVEEIAKKIWAIHAFPRGETDWDRAVEQARLLIASTLKAVVDGGLELPRQIKRIDVDAYVGELLEWIEELPQHTELIALRPTGTGEEK